MQFNIKELSARGKEVRLTENVDMSDLLEGRQDIASYGPLTADLTVNTKSGITEVKGELKVPLKLVCSRCLGDVEQTLSIPFRETFAERPELVAKDELDDTHIVTTDKVDLGPYVEEAVWLALPYTTLCDEECLGLCPVCGANRNAHPCDCAQDKVDPRLAGLKDFFPS